MKNRKTDMSPSLWMSLTPLVFLSGCLAVVLAVKGIDSIAEASSVALLAGAGICILLAKIGGCLQKKRLIEGVSKSARQILPALPLLILIALISSVWMLSGVVPVMIHSGLGIINESIFPLIVFAVCAIVSMLSGSSWTTIGTIGVAFMGIGSAYGFGVGWTAGAIISGAYLGDKISPLSDTTVVVASTCGVDTLKHVRYMLHLTWPAVLITAVVYFAAGIFHDTQLTTNETQHISMALDSSFNLSGLVLLIPLVTAALIMFRVNTVITLSVSVLIGFAGIYIFQPQIAGDAGGLSGILKAVWKGSEITSDYATLTSLTSTSGIVGMLPTLALVMSAMIFGGAMLGCGMLDRITRSFTRRLKGVGTTVSATAGSGLLLVACTSDQYLPLIVGGNMYKRHYEQQKLNPHLLSGTLEAGVTVTSPLLPWSSCGLAHAAMLDVGALVYAPFAFFCWLSPLITILIAKLRCRTKTIMIT